ncbi:MAG: type IV pilus assembly protein PilM, partial [Candidatus Omnitrophota bacterium]|nr:type IV pilus assembly protein PilM [Candidatus Omnitrophota bacterium]
MSWFGNKRFFGIDIGASAIKLIEIKKTREGYRIVRGKLVELDIDPLFDNSEKQRAITKDKLKKLLIEERINSGNAALSISGQSVFIRSLKVPKVAKSKIERIVQYEAQLQVPFPINEVIWGYELFEIPDNPETEISLVAVKNNIVQERIDLLAGTGLCVDFIEVNPFAFFNAVNFSGEAKGKIIIDIGAKFTDIIITEEHKIWTRSVLIGGNNMTKAVAAALNISFKEAEEIKRKEGMAVLDEADKTSASASRAGVISNAINQVLVELLADISKSMGYYKSQFGENKIFKEILITGGCSRLKNIDRYIAE